MITKLRNGQLMPAGFAAAGRQPPAQQHGIPPPVIRGAAAERRRHRCGAQSAAACAGVAVQLLESQAALLQLPVVLLAQTQKSCPVQSCAVTRRPCRRAARRRGVTA